MEIFAVILILIAVVAIIIYAVKGVVVGLTRGTAMICSAPKREKLLRLAQKEHGPIVRKLCEDAWSSSCKRGEAAALAIYHLEHEFFSQFGIRVIAKHEQVLRRKRSQLVFVDDYGIERASKWDVEKRYFVSSVLVPELKSICDCYQDYPLSSTSSFRFYADEAATEALGFWSDLIEAFLIREEFPQGPHEVIRYVDGVSYEQYVADLVKAAGWEAHLTPVSGDQGADIIAQRGLHRLAIQCKMYSSSIGNSAIQEVFAAKNFYECWTALVVSNAPFTLSAKQLASKLGVILMHHDELVARLASMTKGLE